MRRVFAALVVVSAAGCAYHGPTEPTGSLESTVPAATVRTPPPVQPLGNLTPALSIWSLVDPLQHPAPTACFDQTGYAAGCFPISAPVRARVAVADDRVGLVQADRYAFDFGDGAVVTSGIEWVDHQYRTGGFYLVRATATMADGRSATTTQPILVR